MFDLITQKLNIGVAVLNWTSKYGMVNQWNIGELSCNLRVLEQIFEHSIVIF